jgi:hypothetical protein
MSSKRKKVRKKIASTLTPEQASDEAVKRAARLWLSFADLQAEGVTTNWQTLSVWVRNEGFPPGRLFGPNSRRWTREEINEWLASRPTTREGEAA